MSKVHDECGVFGMYSPDGRDVVSASYYALYALQHRGQESCGIALNDRGVISYHRDAGLVSEVMTESALRAMGPGSMVVGHVRYATMGMEPRKNAQPLVVNHVKGQMALAHNGALSNASELREDLEMRGAIFHTTSDTEVISYVITQERLKASSIEEAISAAMPRLEGAYSLVVMSPTKLMAVRDPHGFRPLCIGKLGESTVFASESCALDAIGAHFVRDVAPGEIVVVDKSGMHSLTLHVDTAPKTTCVFEYIYFARPDSVIDGSSVHTARLRAGSSTSIPTFNQKLTSTGRASITQILSAYWLPLLGLLTVLVGIIMLYFSRKPTKTPQTIPAPPTPDHTDPPFKFCIFCGAKNKPIAIYCKQCGQKIE